MFQFGFNMFPEIPRPFNVTYRCYSVAMLPGNERQDVEKGGKIIMPPSALEQLTRLNIIYPMLFKLTNKKTSRVTHCGVLEFIADEGKVYLPLWMMNNLILEEGDQLQVESVSLPVATFSKFQPLSSDFLDITNPKAVLENCLRTFACLTTGDVIAVKYNQKAYELCVLETKPKNAVNIIECDMNVEFAPPVGYKEPRAEKKEDEEMAVDPADLMPEPSGFVAFQGAGNRLDGKRRKDPSVSEMTSTKPTYVRGIPDYDYTPGFLKFIRKVDKPVTASTSKDKDDSDDFKAFSGNGFSLVEFAPPVGYKEPRAEKKEDEEMAVDPADLMPEPSGFVAFQGAGNRLDGKRRKDPSVSEMTSTKPTYVRGIPDYDYTPGFLKFIRKVDKPVTASTSKDKDDSDDFKAFSGNGFSLVSRR